MDFSLSSTLYRRNLLWQQAEVRWRAVIGVYHLLNRRRRSCKHQQYIVSVSSVFVLLLDIVLGLLVSWLWTRYDIGRRLEDIVTQYTLVNLRVTRELLSWMMGTPAGLKLNTSLSLFLGSRCLYILNLWEIFYRDFLSRYLHLLISPLPSLTCTVGLSLTLAVVHDFFKFLNLCQICFYVFSNRLLTLQLTTLLSLGRLFMGKKWNVLRQRVDSCRYHTNQLLLGTIVFTTLLFLLPTTTVFATLFLSLRVFQWIVQLLIRILVVGINWSTVRGCRYLDCIGSDMSLLNVRVREEEMNEGGEKEGSSLIVVEWNGKVWGVSEMREIVSGCSVEDVLCDVIGQEEKYNDHPLATVAGLWSTL